VLADAWCDRSAVDFDDVVGETSLLQVDKAEKAEGRDQTLLSVNLRVTFAISASLLTSSGRIQMKRTESPAHIRRFEASTVLTTAGGRQPLPELSQMIKEQSPSSKRISWGLDCEHVVLFVERDVPCNASVIVCPSSDSDCVGVEAEVEESSSLELAAVREELVPGDARQTPSSFAEPYVWL
jgi:hypothetical protein